jgi:solute:Na+ symporter, SSS family
VRPFDWLVVAAYLVWIVTDGLRRTKNVDKVEGFFLASRSLPWWVAGISVMATQLSAITLVGTTGQAYATGLRFIQFYLGLPLAMILLSLTLVPFFHRARVYTAYEYLERRFDVRTRTLTSFLFLMSRATSLGVVIAAPAVVMSTILGWSMPITVAVLSLPMVFYTALGGVQAVAWIDVKQMFVIVFGLFSALAVLIAGLPGDVSIVQALRIAGSTGRLAALDFRFDLSETYTFWSGLIGGLFLMLSYFGCDQSQVQRYLTAKSVDGARRGLLMSAYVKIPLQIVILTTGVLVFIFYVFTPPPMLFNRIHDGQVAASAQAFEYSSLQHDFDQAFAERRAAANSGDRAGFLQADARMVDIRGRAAGVVRQASGDSRYSDVNYVFPTFITTRLPIGLTGLMIAAIFAAAMSAASGELSSLTSATIIDFYQRHFVKGATDRHYLYASRFATTAWGLFACGVAMFAADQGSLIEVVNRYGSLFYGSILGVFLLAIVTTRARAEGAFWGLIAGMAVVLVVAFQTNVAFLWHNLIGAAVVFVVGMAVSITKP